MKNLDEVINQLGRKIDQQIPTDSSMSRLKRNQLIVVGLYKAASSISSKDAGNDFKLVTSLTRLLEGYVVKLDDTAVDDLYREKRDQLIPVESDTKGGNSNYIVSLRTSLRKISVLLHHY
jgi:hypothetical protein